MSDSLSPLIPSPLTPGRRLYVLLSPAFAQGMMTAWISSVCNDSWLTEEHYEAVVGLVTCCGCSMVSILSVSVEALEMLFAIAAEALAPQAWDWKPDNLL